MISFLQIFLESLSLGITYAVSAIGFVMIFKLSRVLNFAHGTFMAIGTLLFVFISCLNLPVVLILILTFTGAFATGFITESLIKRTMNDRNSTLTIILSIGIFLTVKALLTFFTGKSDCYPGLLFITGTLELGAFQIDRIYLMAILTGSILLTIFGMLLKYSSYGIYLRALSDNNYNALALGIRAGRISVLAWSGAAVFAAISGIFLHMAWGINPLDLNIVGLKVFPAVILGGLHHYRGAILGGLIIGLLETFVGKYLSVSLANIVPYIALLVMIPVKPNGFFQK